MISNDKPFELRPLDYGGILDRTFELYRLNFVLFLSISALIFVPLSMGSACFGYYMVLNYGIGHLPMVATIAALVGVLLGMIVQGALTIAVGRRYLGLPATLGQCYLEILPLLFPLILTTLMWFLMILVGCILIIPGIIFAFWGIFVGQVVILERRFFAEAISRSRSLISGDVWGRAMVLGILTGLIVWVLEAAAGAGLNLLLPLANAGISGLLVHQAISGLLQALFVPISLTAFIILYYDVRVRKEAFDLQQLAAAVGHAELAHAWPEGQQSASFGGGQQVAPPTWEQQQGAPPTWEQQQGAPPAWGQQQGASPAWGQQQGTPPAWGQQVAPQQTWGGPQATPPPSWGAPTEPGSGSWGGPAAPPPQGGNPQGPWSSPPA